MSFGNVFQGLATSSKGDLFIADGSKIRRVDTAGIITTVVGRTEKERHFVSSGSKNVAAAAMTTCEWQEEATRIQVGTYELFI